MSLGIIHQVGKSCFLIIFILSIFNKFMLIIDIHFDALCVKKYGKESKNINASKFFSNFLMVINYLGIDEQNINQILLF